MKGNSLKLILALSFLLGIELFAHAQVKVTFLFNPAQKGQVKSFDVPLEDGRFLYLNLIKAKIDSQGKIILHLKLKRPGVINFEHQDLIEVYVEPKTSVIVDLRDSVVFSGSLSAENKMMRSLKRNGIAFAVNPDLRPKIMLHMSLSKGPSDLFSKLDSLLLSANQLIYKLSQAPNISTEFLRFANSDTKLYYYDIAFAVLHNKFSDYIYKPVKFDSALVNSTWGLALREIATKMNSILTQEHPQSSQWFFSCMYDYIVRYKVWFLKENTQLLSFDSSERFVTDLFTGAVPEAINAHLSATNKEFFVANFLSYYITGNIQFYQQEMIEMFNEYKKYYSSSMYFQPLKNKIQEVLSYMKQNGVKKESLKVKIIDNFDSINSFETLIAPFSGKVVYIDVWATWCGPCIDEFKSYNAIHELMQKNKNFEVLYISRDSNEGRERWEQFIIKKQLTGYHLIPNSKLTLDLTKKMNYNEIPRYLIVDSSGRIVNNDAPAPSNPETIELISRYIKEE